MKSNGKGSEEVARMKEKLVFMWGYLPGALPQKTPIFSPVAVPLPQGGGSWRDVCGGGCGFAMAISDFGKLITWGSADDLGQSYLTAGKHGEAPEPFPLPADIFLVNADAGWAHCVATTASGDVYTWGWKECIPSGKVLGDPATGPSMEKDTQNLMLTEQVSPRSHGSRSGGDIKGGADEFSKRRRISPAKQAVENSPSGGDEPLSASPCLVSLNPGVRIVSVAAGGRHTLALSVTDVGQVWGWGYGGDGQLGMGSRIRMVSSPHPVPCIGLSYNHETSRGNDTQTFNVPGTHIKSIACGGRHSAVVTDAGALLTFGWGLYGQCGQGSTDDELSPICVSSLLGISISSVAAGLWHSICISTDGDVYAFGGNQFGQLGTGADQAETLPRLLDSPNLENVNAKIVSCGARHSAVVAEDGRLFSWGWNKYGQLGLGDMIDRNIPSVVTVDGYSAKNVACGWWHTVMLGVS
ncbi:hypothetical protein M569_15948, partial [Genlisea aurea]